MRIDKFLKVSRVIKRRTVAQEACDGGRVSINGKNAKPGTDVKIGDIVEVRFGNNTTKFRVESLADHVAKDNAKEMFTIL